jgi:hypothetical protein
VTSNLRREPLFDVDPRTGANIEVFYAYRRLETFGRHGAGWFWWPRRRGFSPDGPATGPFPTSYAAYRDAMSTDLCDAWAAVPIGGGTPRTVIFRRARISKLKHCPTPRC